MPSVDIDFRYLLPEIILAIFGAAVLIIGLWTGKRDECHRFWDNFTPELLTGAALVLAASVTILIPFGWGRLIEAWPPALGDGAMANGHYAADQMAFFFKIIAIGTALIVLWMSTIYLKIKRAVRGEYYAFLLFATLAACLVASANELILLWLTLEFLSIVSYILVGYFREDPRSSEASVKYFLFGAASGAIMLYGMSILYGICGTTSLGTIRELMALGTVPKGAVVFSMVLILAGIGFKISMAPFHLWAPDAYEGAPTPITAFLSVASKAAGFIALIRVFVWALPAALPANDQATNWIPMLTLLSVASMTYGNLAAIWQKNLKRMLAYSGIAHCGYILIGVIAAASPKGSPLLGFDISPLASVAIYIAAYAVTNLGVFAILVAIRNRIGSYTLDDYSGLATRNLGAAAALAVLLLSLAGIPPTIGFIGKFFLLLSAIERHLYLLAFFAIANTAVSMYYYYNVCRHMFLIKGKETAEIDIPYVKSWVGVGIVVCTLTTIAFCVYPTPLIDFGRSLAHILPFS